MPHETSKPTRSQIIADLKNHSMARTFWKNNASKALASISDADINKAVPYLPAYGRGGASGIKYSEFKAETARVNLIRKAVEKALGRKVVMRDVFAMYESGQQIQMPTCNKKKKLAGRYTDPDFDFYGRYGDAEDGARERFVSQTAVKDGKTPSGRIATQEEVTDLSARIMYIRILCARAKLRMVNRPTKWLWMVS